MLILKKSIIIIYQNLPLTHTQYMGLDQIVMDFLGESESDSEIKSEREIKSELLIS